MNRPYRILTTCSLVLAFTIGCQSHEVLAPQPEVAPSTARDRITEPASPIETRVSVNPRHFVRGDTLRVAVAIRNNGNDSVRVIAGECLGFELHDRCRRLLASKCDAFTSSFQLAPGAGVSVHFGWVPERTTGDGAKPLRPGRYALVGKLFRVIGPSFSSESVTIWQLPVSIRQLVEPPFLRRIDLH
jgi:hypothetical protein